MIANSILLKRVSINFFKVNLLALSTYLIDKLEFLLLVDIALESLNRLLDVTLFAKFTRMSLHFGSLGLHAHHHDCDIN